MKSVLRITDLHKRFADKEVLCGLDLFVPEHSIYGFIGKNGSGKTTTMKSVLGLVRPDKGEITVNGERVIYGQTPTNRYVGYLPDVPEFYSFMTAREYMKYCGRISGLTDAEGEKRCTELLERVGLADERHRIKGFSRGMKQRLGIAQALINRPALLICDEPTSALDPTGRKEILDILSSLSDQTTVLFSTHILSDVERICTDVAFLNNGRIEICGKLADIKSKYRSEKYLVETEDRDGAMALCSAFGKIKLLSENQLVFSEKEVSVSQLLRFISDNSICILKIERVEPTLEALFVEVTGK